MQKCRHAFGMLKLVSKLCRSFIIKLLCEREAKYLRNCPGLQSGWLRTIWSICSIKIEIPCLRYSTPPKPSVVTGVRSLQRFMIPKHCSLGLLWQGIQPSDPSKSWPPFVTLEMKPVSKSALKHLALAASVILAKYFPRADSWLAAISFAHSTHSSERVCSCNWLQVDPHLNSWLFAVFDERPTCEYSSIQESKVL